MEVRRTAVVRIIELIKPCGVRQGLYLSEIKYTVEETEAGYEKMQRAIEEALLETARTFRRALWCDADVYVELWVEKDVLSGTIYDVTAEYDVPLMVARGYSRLTFPHSAAEAIKANGKPAYVNHLDEGPSGRDSVANIEHRLRQYVLGIPTNFERLALTERLIAEWNLPTQPATKTDRRAKHWAGDSIELDAIPPDTLRGIVRNAILQYISPERLHGVETTEQYEREIPTIWIAVHAEAQRRRTGNGDAVAVPWGHPRICLTGARTNAVPNVR
jgi:hypothetical protein